MDFPWWKFLLKESGTGTKIVASVAAPASNDPPVKGRGHTTEKINTTDLVVSNLPMIPSQTVGLPVFFSSEKN